MPCPCTPLGDTGGSSRHSLCYPAPQPPGCTSYSGTRPPNPFITKSSLIRVQSQAAAELLPHPCLPQAEPPFQALLRCRMSRELLPAPPHSLRLLPSLLLQPLPPQTTAAISISSC